MEDRELDEWIAEHIMLWVKAKRNYWLDENGERIPMLGEGKGGLVYLWGDGEQIYEPTKDLNLCHDAELRIRDHFRLEEPYARALAKQCLDNADAPLYLGVDSMMLPAFHRCEAMKEVMEAR